MHITAEVLFLNRLQAFGVFPYQRSVLLSRTDSQLIIFTGVHVRLHGYGRAETQ